MRNQGGIATKLANTYTQPAAIPPMPWVSSKAPGAPGLSAAAEGTTTVLRWQPDGSTAKIAVQAKIGGTWRTVKIAPGSSQSLTIPRAEAVAAASSSRRR